MWRKIAIFVLLVVAGIGVVLAIGWSRVRSVPDWYEGAIGVEAGEPTPGAQDRSEERGETGPLPSARDSARDSAPGSVARPRGSGQPEAWLELLRREGRVSLGAEELRQLAVTALRSSSDGREFLRVNRSIRGRVTDGVVEIGGVFDMAALDPEALTADTRETLERIRGMAPGLLGRELYLGARGTPVASDGALGLGPGATVQVGEASLPVEMLVWAATRAGSERSSDPSGAAGGAGDLTTLSLPGLRVSRARVVGDRLVIDADPVTDP